MARGIHVFIVFICLLAICLFAAAGQMLSFVTEIFSGGVPNDIPLKLHMHEGLNDGFLPAFLFVEQIRHGAIAQAHAQATAGFKQRHPGKEFEAYIRKLLPTVGKEKLELEFKPKAVAPGTFAGTFQGAERSVSFTVKAVQEDGEWKVDDFTVAEK